MSGRAAFGVAGIGFLEKLGIAQLDTEKLAKFRERLAKARARVEEARAGTKPWKNNGEAAGQSGMVYHVDCRVPTMVQALLDIHSQHPDLFD